jgi:hypothetical protein
VRRLTPADLLVLLAAVALVALMALPWFSDGAGDEITGWGGLGWAAPALVVLTLVLALATVALLAAGARDGVNVPPAVFLAALAPITTLVTLVAVALKPGDATAIEPAAWAGVLLLALLTVGAWRSMADERVRRPTRRVDPPPARPAPPPATDAAATGRD